MPKPVKPAEKTEIKITPPNFQVLECTIEGDAPLVSNNFPDEAIRQIKEKQAAGGQGGTRVARAKKDFEAGFIGSQHIAEDGWVGMPAIAFRSMLVRACSNYGVEMTRAKQCIFVLADGFERDRGVPLVRIYGEPERLDSYVRNATGVADIRARARFAPGWTACLRVRYDADFFSAEMVANLIARAGISVGLGAGRPFSTASVGQGWGTFVIADTKGKTKATAKAG